MKSISISRTKLDWLTGDVLSPALRAHCVRPKSLPAILSLCSQRRWGTCKDGLRQAIVSVSVNQVLVPSRP